MNLLFRRNTTIRSRYPQSRSNSTRLRSNVNWWVWIRKFSVTHNCLVVRMSVSCLSRNNHELFLRSDGNQVVGDVWTHPLPTNKNNPPNEKKNKKTKTKQQKQHPLTSYIRTTDSIFVG